MIDAIFKEMPQSFQLGKIDKSISYYFSIDECKKTVFIDAQNCRVEEGKTTDSADCVCKTSTEFFERIWNEGYRPGVKDFLSGAIRSNNPEALRTLLIAFGKNA
ncbi:hypothetical protein [Geopsychrobacter electrodiphilus]|uniref:hypothetical protein n=1 Tax=Geopsychrobacter electrodiphilus TaxID=225196 RepID=UPI00036B2708|nr:hypothetical protein [Geopsychrobacter electrodiphilus]